MKDDPFRPLPPPLPLRQTFAGAAITGRKKRSRVDMYIAVGVVGALLIALLSVAAGLMSLGLLIIHSAFGLIAESPSDYTQVTYDMLQPEPAKTTEPVPQSALDMQDKKVLVKGYMQPRRQQTGIKEFILCPSNGEAPFCIPNPKRTEMIRVVLQGDLEAAYTTHLIGVGGRFQVDANDSSGIPYTLAADYLH